LPRKRNRAFPRDRLIPRCRITGKILFVPFPRCRFLQKPEQRPPSNSRRCSYLPGHPGINFVSGQNTSPFQLLPPPGWRARARATEPDSTAFSTRGGRKLFPDVEYLVKYKLVKHLLSGRPVCFQDHDCPFPELPDDKVTLETMIIQQSGKRGPKDQRSGVCLCLNCMNTSARFPGSWCLY
jgi:hypothetical protein